MFRVNLEYVRGQLKNRQAIGEGIFRGLRRSNYYDYLVNCDNNNDKNKKRKADQLESDMASGVDTTITDVAAHLHSLLEEIKREGG